MFRQMKGRKKAIISKFSKNLQVINLNMIIFSYVLFSPDEKVLNSLNRCGEFFGAFNARHDSFKSLLRFLSISKA